MSAVAACACSGSQAVAAWVGDLDTGRPMLGMLRSLVQTVDFRLDSCHT